MHLMPVQLPMSTDYHGAIDIGGIIHLKDQLAGDSVMLFFAAVRVSRKRNAENGKLKIQLCMIRLDIYN